jgi:hypothetical protein
MLEIVLKNGQEVISKDTYRTVCDLLEDNKDFITVENETPNPFIWSCILKTDISLIQHNND